MRYAHYRVPSAPAAHTSYRIDSFHLFPQCTEMIAKKSSPPSCIVVPLGTMYLQFSFSIQLLIVNWHLFLRYIQHEKNFAFTNCCASFPDNCCNYLYRYCSNPASLNSVIRNGREPKSFVVSGNHTVAYMVLMICSCSAPFLNYQDILSARSHWKTTWLLGVE